MPMKGKPKRSDSRDGKVSAFADVAALEAFDANFIPSVRAPMCVGLGNPEMLTLITFAGEPSGSTAEAVTQ